MYQVILPKSVQKDLAKIDRRYQPRIYRALAGLAENPFTGKPLYGEFKGFYSTRVWPYRIVYKIIQDKLIVLVIDIGHRQRLYK